MPVNLTLSSRNGSGLMRIQYVSFCNTATYVVSEACGRECAFVRLAVSLHYEGYARIIFSFIGGGFGSGA